MSGVRRLRALLVLLACLLVLPGCMGLPDSGPVVEVRVEGELDVDPPPDIDAEAPRPGMTRLQVVQGFLEAMTAWPIQTNVAAEYLTEESAEDWHPESSTIVYTEELDPREVAGAIRIDLTAADHLDATGGWQGALPPGLRTVDFRVTVEDGEFRIVDPVDALIVSSDWFQQRYRQVATYYFDPLAEILVPEPVFVPVGEQLATSLVSALLAGPPPRLRDIVRSFVPPGLSYGLSVPVTDNGVAQLALDGDVRATSAEQAELMLAQFAWTLRQDPSIDALEVTLGGEEVPLPGGATLYDVEDAAEYDPAGVGSTGLLYGLRRGRLVVGGTGSFGPADGPLSRRDNDLSAVSVSPDAAEVAAVTSDRSDVVVAPVRSAGGGVRTVVSGGEDLARPTWDYAGRLWVLDRRASGAVVMVVEGNRPRTVRVPSVTGADARRLLVSRDGTRLVAVVRGPAGDRLVASRVAIGRDGRVARVVHPVRIWTSGGQQVTDIVWTDPATLAVLTPARPGGLSEVESVPADGSAYGVASLDTVVSGRVTGLAATPSDSVPVYAVRGSELVDVRTGETTPVAGGRVRFLDYAG